MTLSLAGREPALLAQGTDGELAPRSAPPRVEIAVVGASPGLDALPDRVASWFRGSVPLVRAQRLLALPPGAVLTPNAEPGVDVWILLDSQVQARLFFSLQEKAAGTPRYLVTEVPLPSGLNELGMEQIAQVAYLSATALWEGRLESTRLEVESKLRVGADLTPPLPPPVPAAKSEKTKAVEVPWKAGPRFGLGYGVRWRGEEGPAHGPAASAAESWRRRALELGGVFRAQLLLPVEAEAFGTTLDVRGYALSLGASASAEVSRAAWLTGELAMGLDVIRHRTVSVGDSLEPAKGATDLRPVTTLGAGARWKLGRIGVAASASVTVQWLRTHYDVSEAEDRSRLLTPWVVQPGLFAGLIW